MKKEFKSVEIEIIVFSTDDVITASAIEGGLDEFSYSGSYNKKKLPLV